MRKAFATIEAASPLSEVFECLTDSDEHKTPLPLIVVNGDGTFAGVLTPMALYRALLRKVRLNDIPALGNDPFLEKMREQLNMPVSEAMVREVPRAYPDDGLCSLMRINIDRCEPRIEFTPVLENDSVIGIVYVTEIFHAAASLTLTPDTEGIRLDSDKDDELSH